MCEVPASHCHQASGRGYYYGVTTNCINAALRPSQRCCWAAMQNSSSTAGPSGIAVPPSAHPNLAADVGRQEESPPCPSWGASPAHTAAAPGSSQRECWLAPGKAAIASLGTGNRERWLALWQKSEGCTRSPKSLQCARKHKLSSYSAVCKSNVFNSRRAISKPSTLTTARVCSKVKRFNITYSFAVKY